MKLKKFIKNYSEGIGFILCVAIMALAILQVFGIWTKAVNVFEPLLGLLILLQALENWDTKRKSAIICLGAAIVIFLVTILIWIF